MNIEITIIKSLKEFREVMEYCNSFDIIAVDTETNSVVEKKAILWGVGFSVQEGEGFYVPFKNPDGSEVLPSDIKALVIKSLVELFQTKKLIGHNFIYDALVLKNNWGIDFTSQLYADTILMKHLIDEEKPHGLKETAEKYLGSWAVKAQEKLYASIDKNGGSTTKSCMEMYKADLEVLGEYCAYDVALTMSLYNLFTTKIKEEGLEKLFYEDEIMPLYKEVVIPMKDKGFPVDVAHFRKIKSEIEIEISNLEKEIYEDIQEHIVKFERVLLWKEFETKKKGNFPKALAKVLDVTLPERGGQVSLIKKLVSSIEAKNEQQALFLSWLLKDETPLPKELYTEATAAHNLMWTEKYGDTAIFNLGSNDHLSWLFFERLGMRPLEFTPTGKPKLNADTLESLANQHQFADKIIVFKKLQKLLSTYVDGILERQIDGVLYTSMKLFGTTSGRFASSDPNLNNLPALKEDDGSLHPLILKYTNAIRAGMIAGKDKKIIGLDFESLEPHVAAYVSGDEGLVEIFANHQDFYSGVAIKQFGIKDASPYKEDANYFGKKYKTLRARTKTYSLAAFYGATAPRISQVLGSTREEAQGLLDGYFTAFPGVKTFIEQTHEQAMTTGKVFTMFGRPRHLYQIKGIIKKHGNKILDYKWANARGLLEERRKLKNLLNNSVNFQIQGFAAHCLNRAMLNITREIKEKNLKAYIVLPIHDEILIIVDEEQVDMVKNIAKIGMETCVNMGKIKLKSTPIVGNSYAECK